MSKWSDLSSTGLPQASRATHSISGSGRDVRSVVHLDDDHCKLFAAKGLPSSRPLTDHTLFQEWQRRALHIKTNTAGTDQAKNLELHVCLGGTRWSSRFYCLLDEHSGSRRASNGRTTHATIARGVRTPPVHDESCFLPSRRKDPRQSRWINLRRAPYTAAARAPVAIGPCTESVFIPRRSLARTGRARTQRHSPRILAKNS